MKSMNLFCASPASTAICSSTDQYSVVRGHVHGRRSVHRHRDYVGDQRKGQSTASATPCSSQLLQLDPMPYSYQRSGESSAKQSDPLRRKNSDDVNDLSSPTDSSSSRYLLSDTPLIDLLSDSDHSLALIPKKPSRMTRLSSNDDTHSLKSSSTVSNEHPFLKSSSTKSNDSCLLKYSSSTSSNESLLLKSSSSNSSNNNSMLRSSSTSSRPCHHQVVELRVSIHCKGCEGKVRKHISRMEGVTSFSIDLATKKVTVRGNVTPLGVLTSISRVKNAQFWPSSSSSSPAVGFRY